MLDTGPKGPYGSLPRLEHLDAGAGPRLSRACFDRLGAFLFEASGIRLSPQKMGMVEARLRRRLRLRGASSFEAYWQLTQGDAEERQALLDVLTTHKTDFFREAHHFELLAHRVAAPFRQMWEGQGRALRVWSAGCSSGPEVYSAAMVLSEHLGSLPFEILGTDVSAGVLDQARSARYPLDVLPEIPQAYRRFVRQIDEREFTVDPALCRRAQFRVHNLMDAHYPRSPRHHVIFCRNTLVYFDRSTQRKVLEKLIESLVPRGFLFLGHSECVRGMGLPLEAIGPTAFRKNGTE